MPTTSFVRTLTAAAAVGATALSLAACGSSDSTDTSSAASGSAGGKTVIKYGTENYVMNMPELADALGYFPNLTLKPVTNGLTIPPAQFIQSVLKGDVTYGFSNFGALITANAQGQKAKAVITFNGNAGTAAGGIYVKADSPIKTAKDLIGKKIAFVPGTLSELIFDRYLAENGVSIDQVKHVQVSYAGNGGEQEVRNGQLDAFETSGGQKTAAVARGGIRELVSDQQVLGTIALDSYFFSDEWIQQHPAAIKEFVAGTAKAIEYSRTQPTAKVLKVYTDYLDAHGQSDEVSAFKGWTTNGDLKGGVITAPSFEQNEKWLVQLGQLKEGQVSQDQVFTNEFNPYASQVPNS